MNKRTDRIIAFISMYLMGSMVVGGLYSAFTNTPDTWLNVITLILFWPLFFIKALGLGVIAVLSNLVTLLF